MRQLVSTDPELMTRSYRPSDFVRHCTVDGAVVILNLRTGKYLVLDAVASYMWNSLLSVPDRGQRIDDIASRFNITRSQSEHDMDEFIESCEKRLLLRAGAAEEHENSVIRMRYKSPNALNAWRCLYATRHSLARSGFSSTYDFHLRLARPETSTTPDALSLPKAVRAFHHAENFFPIRDAPNDCLPRSLALHRFLLSVGLNAEHCLGVRRFPFAAHAWVEVARTIVCDSESFVGQFTEIARV